MVSLYWSSPRLWGFSHGLIFFPKTFHQRSSCGIFEVDISCWSNTRHPQWCCESLASRAGCLCEQAKLKLLRSSGALTKRIIVTEKQTQAPYKPSKRTNGGLCWICSHQGPIFYYIILQHWTQNEQHSNSKKGQNTCIQPTTRLLFDLVCELRGLAHVLGIAGVKTKEAQCAAARTSDGDPGSLREFSVAFPVFRAMLRVCLVNFWYNVHLRLINTPEWCYFSKQIYNKIPLNKAAANSFRPQNQICWVQFLKTLLLSLFKKKEKSESSKHSNHHHTTPSALVLST